MSAMIVTVDCDDSTSLHLVPFQQYHVRGGRGSCPDARCTGCLTCYAMLRWSAGSTFIACMLTIVGYSINATIVIFDRIRENMKLLGNKVLLNVVLPVSADPDISINTVTTSS